MTNETKQELEKRVIVASRENGISYTLFRNQIGKKLGLNTTDFECLDLILFRGMATPSELSRYTGISSGSTTAIIDRLEKSGLVKRQSNPNDRRGAIVVINKNRAARIAPLFMPVRKAQGKLLASCSESDLRLLLDYFQKSGAMFEEERQRL